MHRPEYNEQARNHCLLGATNPQLAELFEVSPRTIDSWIASIPEFGKAVREGRAVANAQVARSLYERAIGFRHTVERTVLHLGQERTITNTVQFRPILGLAFSGCAIGARRTGTSGRLACRTTVPTIAKPCWPNWTPPASGRVQVREGD